MDYGPSDSSGTDDDLPPSHGNRMPRGGDRVVGNGRTSVGKLIYTQVETDMETRIHRMEQEAYIAVLRAFFAQSDSFTWDKEELMSDLRKELRVSDMEHRAMLGKVGGDDVLRRMREYRQAASNQHRFIASGAHSAVKALDPTVSASCKKQKTAEVMASLPQPAIPSTMRTVPTGLTNLAARKGASGKKFKGRYSADVRWGYDGQVDINREEAGHAEKMLANHGSFNMPSSRGKGFPKGQSAKGYASLQNGTCRKKPENIELRQTDKLIKEVERVCRGDHPDPSAVENAKMALKEHEQSLIEAIARLGNLSDEEDGRMPNSFHVHTNQERMWRNRQVNGNGSDIKEDIARGCRGGGSNREPIVGEGGVASDDDYIDEDD
uniref:TSA: Wollemia nobilis Ref_Wollemi_Transcript_9822_1680 transcribed RNA sequence n=1 Tax=Wollemia nobilis TaxID=56998 RepID=A0A0C9RW33_9CONI